MAERVLVYGSRSWADRAPIEAFVRSLAADAVVITGGARGADELAEVAALARGLEVEVYPVPKDHWRVYGRAAGVLRNQRMIDEGHPTRGRGFRSGGPSPGTDDMTRRLRRARIPTEVTREEP